MSNKKQPSTNDDFQKRVLSALEKVRPMLKQDGGDVELVKVNEKEGCVFIRLIGICAHCPMAEITLQEGIAATLKETVPKVRDVIAV